MSNPTDKKLQRRWLHQRLLSKRPRALHVLITLIDLQKVPQVDGTNKWTGGFYECSWDHVVSRCGLLLSQVRKETRWLCGRDFLKILFSKTKFRFMIVIANLPEDLQILSDN